MTEPKTVIQRICGWCGKDMGEKDGDGNEGTSHSICSDCFKEMTGQDQPAS